jgi:hypothetical protein
MQKVSSYRVDPGKKKHDRRQRYDHEACRIFRQRVKSNIDSDFLSPFPVKGVTPVPKLWEICLQIMEPYALS